MNGTSLLRLRLTLLLVVIFLAGCTTPGRSSTLGCSQISLAVAERIGGQIRTGWTTVGTKHSESFLDGRCYWIFDGYKVEEIPCTPMRDVILENPENYVKHFRVWNISQ
jgi:hypothetical protein